VLTQCPGCKTVFRITGAILRAAHGQVRCGRCNTQFDAVQNVFDEEQLPVEPTSKPVAEERTAYMPPPPDDASGDEVESFMSSVFDQADTQNEQITMEGDRVNPEEVDHDIGEFMDDGAVTDDSIIEVFNVDSAEWTAPDPDPLQLNSPGKSSVESAPPESPSTRVDEMTRVRHAFFDQATDEPPLFAETQDEQIEFSRVVNDDAQENVDPEVEAFNQALYMTELENALKDPTGQPDDAENEELDSAPEKTRVRRWATTRSKQHEAPPDVLELGHVDAPPVPRHRLLALGCIGLTLLLMFQIIHHYRQTLVRHPTFGPALNSIYSVFGKHLEPRWEVNAYSIKQWGIVSDPQEPGVLRVRASVTNNASFAQPYPWLKLTLEDRFGSHLGMRTFKPPEYLPSATSATRLLDAGTAANVDLAIVDPGEEAVGFQFDSCLGDENIIRCAHE